MNYEAQVVICHKGGSAAVDGQQITFTDVDDLTLLVDAATDFVQDRSKAWHGELPHAAVVRRLDAAKQASLAALQREHTRVFQSLFNRVSLDLGQDPQKSRLPTDRRLVDLKTKGPDHGLEALLFQYGRYLLISSSRPGSLPANLQGRWNNSNTPPWRSDYHTDINVQMNYWLADQANLGDCFLPYADWLNSIHGVRRDETAAAFHSRGWTMHAENGVFGGSTWAWVESGSAWCARTCGSIMPSLATRSTSARRHIPL